MHRIFFNSDHCNNNYFQRLYTSHIDTISSGPRFLHYWQVLDASNSWFIDKDGEFSTPHTQPKEIPMDILKCQLNCIEKRREIQIPTNINNNQFKHNNHSNKGNKNIWPAVIWKCFLCSLMAIFLKAWLHSAPKGVVMKNIGCIFFGA